jgi:hypothetical protein
MLSSSALPSFFDRRNLIIKLSPPRLALLMLLQDKQVLHSFFHHSIHHTAAIKQLPGQSEAERCPGPCQVLLTSSCSRCSHSSAPSASSILSLQRPTLSVGECAPPLPALLPLDLQGATSPSFLNSWLSSSFFPADYSMPALSRPSPSSPP